MHFGRIPTDSERRKWIEAEGGIEADKRRLADTARKKTHGEPEAEKQ
jgi:hypothetical protein